MKSHLLNILLVKYPFKVSLTINNIQRIIQKDHWDNINIISTTLFLFPFILMDEKNKEEIKYIKIHPYQPLKTNQIY